MDSSDMNDMVRQALQSWADHVEGLVLGRAADGKVVPFRGAAV
jgi:hypothetical protein